jgi:hypothetical protein
MDYYMLYIIFSIVFLGGLFAYWFISSGLRDPKQIYIVSETVSREKETT